MKRTLFLSGLILLCLTTVRGGSIARLFYDGITGTAISTLTNAPIFPDGPTFREQLDDFSTTAAGALVTGLQGKENSGNNFGSYIRGFLEAPETGDYIFYIASDDTSELWLSNNHIPAGKVRIAFDSVGGSTLFEGDRLSERRSSPIQLTRGEKYYLEALHKQAAGASRIQVGWARPDGNQEIIPTRHLWQHPIDPYLGRAEPNLPPVFNDFGNNGGNLPETLSLNEGDSLALELDVIAAQPAVVEWNRNGATLAGENRSYLKFQRIPASYNGSTITAVVRNTWGTLTSTPLRLTVAADATPPQLLGVDHQGNPNSLLASFSEPLDEAFIQLINFEVKTSGGQALPLDSVTLQNNGSAVLLRGNFGFIPGAAYQFLVRGVQDLADVPNQISPTSVPFDFSGEFIGSIGFSPSSPLTDLSITENQSGRFEVLLKGAKPSFYQWSYEGRVIPNATNNVLEVIANSSSTGSYQVSVSNSFSSAISPVVRLRVQPDTNPPVLVSIQGYAGAPGRVFLTFNEPVEVNSSTATGNYLIEGAEIQNALLSPDGKVVTLITREQSAGEIYFLSLRGVKDRAAAGNFSSAHGSFIAELDYAGEVLRDRPARYWRFNETGGTVVSSEASILDSLSTSSGTLVNSPRLGQPSLLPGVPGAAIELGALSSQRITIPNGSDLNATAGPWAKKTVEFWFTANSLPDSEASGLAATAGIWEQGAATRSFAVYLWRDPANPGPDTAVLIAHAFNTGNDGPGSPFGLTSLPAVVARASIRRGETYHVAAVLDGSTNSTGGSLILYLNGSEVSRATGVGQLYNHTGDVQIGRGNGLIHTGENGDFGFFDGTLDEVAVYNVALSPERVQQHYLIGSGEAGGGSDGLALKSVFTRGNSNEVFVTFTKPLDESTATNTSNFSVSTGSTTIAPTVAELLPESYTVQLKGDFAFLEGEVYTLHAQNITAGNFSLLPDPSSDSFSFTNGSVRISSESELANQTVPENGFVQLKAVATGSGPFLFEWFRNGQRIPWATGQTLAFEASTTNSGNYVVRISNSFSQTESTPVAISLESDLTPPALLNIKALAGSINRVRLSFDEPIDPQAAVDLTRFEIPGLLLNSISIDPSGREITLNTAPQTSGGSYTLHVRGLPDRSSAGNPLTVSRDFTSSIEYSEEVLSDQPVRYWRLEETSGTTASSLAFGLDKTNLNATLINKPSIGVPGLLNSDPLSHAILLGAAASNRLTVPNGSDLNAIAGPWSKKTIQFWFRAASLPAPGKTGLAATSGLWEQGAATRNISVYLWRDPNNQDPGSGELILHAINNASDGAGAPYGPPASPATFAKTSIRINQTYHVVAVFDGDASGLNGRLLLYVNGQRAAEAPGIGQIYNHTGDIQIGRGNGLIHTGENGDFGFFDGVIDEISLYNRALDPTRVAQLYAIGSAQPLGGPIKLRTHVDAGHIVIDWDGPGLLTASDSASGPYHPVQNATQPYSEDLSNSAQRFFQVTR